MGGANIDERLPPIAAVISSPSHYVTSVRGRNGLALQKQQAKLLGRRDDAAASFQLVTRLFSVPALSPRVVHGTQCETVCPNR